MPDVPEDLDLPRFSRPIGLTHPPDAARSIQPIHARIRARLTNSNPHAPTSGVLPRFTGLLNLGVTLGGWPFLGHSYLVLHPFDVGEGKPGRHRERNGYTSEDGTVLRPPATPRDRTVLIGNRAGLGTSLPGSDSGGASDPPVRDAGEAGASFGFDITRFASERIRVLDAGETTGSIQSTVPTLVPQPPAIGAGSSPGVEEEPLTPLAVNARSDAEGGDNRRGRGDDLVGGDPKVYQILRGERRAKQSPGRSATSVDGSDGPEHQRADAPIAPIGTVATRVVGERAGTRQKDGVSSGVTRRGTRGVPGRETIRRDTLQRREATDRAVTSRKAMGDAADLRVRRRGEETADDADRASKTRDGREDARVTAGRTRESLSLPTIIGPSATTVPRLLATTKDLTVRQEGFPTTTRRTGTAQITNPESRLEADSPTGSDTRAGSSLFFAAGPYRSTSDVADIATGEPSNVATGGTSSVAAGDTVENGPGGRIDGPRTTGSNRRAGHGGQSVIPGSGAGHASSASGEVSVSIGRPAMTVRRDGAAAQWDGATDLGGAANERGRPGDRPSARNGRRGQERDRREGYKSQTDLYSPTFPVDPAPSSDLEHAMDVDVDRLYRELTRKMRIERERRGL